MPLEQQLVNLKSIASYFEEADSTTYFSALERGLGPGYGLIEAKVLHAMVRHLKPDRVLEVGGGVSSACIAEALRRNGKPATHIVVEPYPSAALNKLEGLQLVKKKVHLVGLEPFLSLGPEDFLFVDSSHTVKPGSDTNYIILEALPRLSPGVTIHLHDINFPYDYRPDLLDTLYQWGETSLLHAFLIGNRNVQVLFSLSHIHHEAPAELKRLIPEYNPMPTKDGLCLDSNSRLYTHEYHLPTSIYLKSA